MSIDVIGGQRSVRTGTPPFLSLHQCGPATWDLQPSPSNLGSPALSQLKCSSARVIWMRRAS